MWSRYAEKGQAFDTFLPERLPRYTVGFFGTILAVALLFLALQRLGIIL
jgi:hypothetical protein